MKPARRITRRRRARNAIRIGLACAGAAIGLASAEAAVTQDNFLARTTDDMVALCSADQSDPLYEAAVNFCQGHAIGTYQVLHELMAAEPKLRLFCIQAPGPSRNDAIAAFVTWVKAHPDRGAKIPVESVAAFLAETYPCPAVAASRPANVKKQ